MVGIGVKTFWMTICQNCTSIVIETSPTNTAISGRSKKYWYAVPYPSSFHWHSAIKQLPWDASDTSTQQRHILSLFIGSVRTSNTNSNFLRRTLFNQCQGDETCVWHPTAHACNGVVNSTTQMMSFLRSQYCPAPPGDSITRKSLFDALLGGCVPVLFAKASFTQYLWFFTKDDLDEVAVFIPKQMILEESANFLDLLKAIPAQELKRKQLAIAKLAPRLQYAVVPNHIHADRGDVWTPPIEDAVDVIISKLLDKQTIEPLQGFSGVDLIHQKCLQNDILQNHADYAGLMPGKSKGEQGKNVAERLWKLNKCQHYNRTYGFKAPSFSIEW